MVLTSKLRLGVTLEKEFAFAVGKINRSGYPYRVCRLLDSLLSLLGLLSLGGLLFGSLLLGGLGKLTPVEREVGAGNIADWEDITGASQVSEDGPGDRSINLELFHDDRAGDAENLGHLGADLVKTLLIEEDIVVELVLNLGLGPGLLLCLGSLALVSLSALGGARALIFYRLLCFSLLHVRSNRLAPRPVRVRITSRAFTRPAQTTPQTLLTILCL